MRHQLRLDRLVFIRRGGCERDEGHPSVGHGHHALKRSDARGRHAGIDGVCAIQAAERHPAGVDLAELLPLAFKLRRIWTRAAPGCAVPLMIQSSKELLPWRRVTP